MFSPTKRVYLSLCIRACPLPCILACSPVPWCVLSFRVCSPVFQGMFSPVFQGMFSHVSGYVLPCFRVCSPVFQGMFSLVFQGVFSHVSGCVLACFRVCSLPYFRVCFLPCFRVCSLPCFRVCSPVFQGTQSTCTSGRTTWFSCTSLRAPPSTSPCRVSTCFRVPSPMCFRVRAKLAPEEGQSGTLARA